MLQPTCPPLHRPEELFAPGATVHGLRAAGVRTAGGSRFLDVWLYQAPPGPLAVASAWKLTGGRGVPPMGISAVAVGVTPTPHLELTLVGEPAPTLYRLEIVEPSPVALDPLRRSLPVRLRPECDALGSCFAVEAAEAPPPPSPVHDYLARDWRSLRRALLEFLIQEHPDADLSDADPTITLLELFAHIGDVLHYRLDRVATEAYLETARRRTSVRRHTRLLDYRLGEAVAATTLVHVQVAPNATTVTVTNGDVAVDSSGRVAFTVDADLGAVDALGEIAIYDWGEANCCLPAGATECVLVRPVPADPLGDPWLAAGDLLVFEVVDPIDRGGHAAWVARTQPWPVMAPVPAFREPLSSRTAQVVGLTSVTPFVDPLLGAGRPLARVTWARADALARNYPVGIDASRGADEVTVARANLVPAHHGRLVGPEPITPRHDGGYLLTSAGDPSRGGAGLALDGTGRPHRLEITVELPSGPVGAEWVDTLLDPEVDAGDFPFVVECEAYDAPTVRFRTGATGLDPPDGTTMSARYEVGGCVVGNVPANALAALQLQAGGSVPARNPVAATGGLDPTPLDVARRDAPEAFAAELRRAVVPADYAAVAATDAAVQRAVARRDWAGSWPLMTTVVDLDVHTDDDADSALTRLTARLDDVRMLGVESVVLPGLPIGLVIGLEVCAAAGYDPERLRLAVLRVLRPGDDAAPGLFHHSRLVLGVSLYLSSVLATVAAVPGVDAVGATQARRLSEPAGTIHDVLTFASDEIAVLDDDPAHPERGRLDIVVRGGS